MPHRIVPSASIRNGFYAWVQTPDGWRVINPDGTLTVWELTSSNRCDGREEAENRVRNYYATRATG